MLDWGRKFLMCSPEHFGVLYEINPWMHKEIRVDRDKAQQQWARLVSNLESAGASIEVMKGQEEWPDLVFTANAGIVNGEQFVPTHFKNEERKGELAYNIEWFLNNGYEIARLPEDIIHEGAGDALPFGVGRNRVLVSGYSTRSEAESMGYLSGLTGASLKAVKLVDYRTYHLDLCFTPLDEERAMISSTAFDKQGFHSLKSMVPEALVLDEDETMSFCCNSVVVDKNIVMPATPVRVGKQLEKWGFNVIESNVSEFMKGGGGVRCLTLALDTVVGAPL